MQLDIAAYGWEDPHWSSLYPDDLPADWQLDFYANEFRAILLPPELCAQRSDAELLVWFAQVHANFSFYWGLRDIAQAERLLNLLQREGQPPALVGFVWLAESPPSGILEQLGRLLPGAVYLDAPPPADFTLPAVRLCWEVGGELHSRGEGLLMRRIDNPPELRPLQQWIRAQQAAGCGQILLAVMPHPGAVQTLRQLATLGVLLNG
ncbi:MAG: hypothetical protein K0A95_04035 [Chromatiales bacterium]|nr:hypothetical protein [Gammaproteobacteria bacterium]MBW6476223.1 hypothetical protein [Chromatiales bacterium]